MEDVRRPSSYSEYPKKRLSPEEEPPNNFNFISLVSGLIAVLFGVFSCIFVANFIVKNYGLGESLYRNCIYNNDGTCKC